MTVFLASYDTGEDMGCVHLGVYTSRAEALIAHPKAQVIETFQLNDEVDDECPLWPNHE